ncbi:hypothetical protein ACUOCP_49920, partial [Escherichia sp. R-CC3]
MDGDEEDDLITSSRSIARNSEVFVLQAFPPSFVISIDNCFLSQRITASFKSPTMKGAFPSL